MRATILALPLLLSATPLHAHTPVPQIPPAAADKVANTLDAVTDAISTCRWASSRRRSMAVLPRLPNSR